MSLYYEPRRFRKKNSGWFGESLRHSLARKGIRTGRKTFAIRRNRVMIAGGLGRYGPYFLVNKRVGKRGYLQASTGSMGNIIKAGYRDKSVSYNITTKTPMIKKKKRY